MDYRKITEIIILIIVLISGVIYVANISQEERIILSPNEVNYLGHDIITSYSAGEKIKGNVNLSFDEFLGESLITSNFEGNITVIDFLEENNLFSGDEYNCSNPTCSPNYVIQEEITSLLINNEGKIAGFSIEGANVFPVNFVKLSISSDAGPACFFSQLFIDVLNDEENLIINNKNSGEICFADYTGCFDDSETSGEVIVAQNVKYCEKITLPPAPAFELGARVKKSTEGNVGELKMILYRADDLGEPLKDCILSDHTVDGYEDLTCSIDYGYPFQADYFVCITTNTDGLNYKIKFDSVDVCGTNSNNFGEPIADYEIFSRAMKFDSVAGLEIDESFSSSHNIELADYIQDYISDIYGGNCQPSCAIPIRFYGQEQLLQFSNIQIQYNSQLGIVEINDFYKLEIEPVTVISSELELDLEKAGFTIPLGSEEDRFILYINGELIFEEDISIAESFEFDISPKFVAFGQNVLFSAETNENITSSTWIFGDGDTETVNGKQATHRYLEEGEFTMGVTLTRSDGVSSTRTFSIIVGNAEEIANLTIAEYKDRLVTLESNIDSFPGWIKNELDNQIDLTVLETSLDSLEENYNNASSDQEFQNIMLDLIDLNIPKEIKISESDIALPLLLGFDNIDTSIIEEVSGKTVDDESELRASIGGWMNEKLDAKISFEKISAFYDDETEVIISKFKVETNPKESIEDVSYLIFGLDIESDGAFMTNYGPIPISGGSYITLEIGQTNKIFEFFLLGEFDSEELGAYISPAIDFLGDFDDVLSPCNFNDICEEELGENKNNCEADCGAGRIPLAILWIIILLVIAFVAYIILQEWYKRHYEKSLFKNENDLYNLINFIYNARRSGLINKDIKKKLNETGWKGERITYALRKIDGKRTGMYEIPIFKFIENKKVKKELAKRQRGRIVDRRFIRRRGHI